MSFTISFIFYLMKLLLFNESTLLVLNTDIVETVKLYLLINWYIFLIY